MRIKSLTIFGIIVMVAVAIWFFNDGEKIVLGASTRVQTKTFVSVDYATSAAGTFASNTTSGNTIVCGTVYNKDVAGTPSIADNKSNSYTLIQNGTVGDIEAYVWYAYNITGGATHTVTVTMSANEHDIAAVCREYSGLLTTDPLDKSSEITTASGTLHTSAATAVTTQNTELVVGILAVEGNRIYTAGTGYGNVSSQNGSDIYEAIGMEDKDITTTGAQTATFTINTATTGYFVVATFKEVEAAPPAVSSANPSDDFIFFE